MSQYDYLLVQVSTTSTLVGSVKSDHPDGEMSYEQGMLWQHSSPLRQRTQGSRRRSTGEYSKLVGHLALH